MPIRLVNLSCLARDGCCRGLLPPQEGDDVEGEPLLVGVGKGVDAAVGVGTKIRVEVRVGVVGGICIGDDTGGGDDGSLGQSAVPITTEPSWLEPRLSRCDSATIKPN